MLYEAPPYYLINGVSILPDHADPLQYYFMPLAPRFVTRRDGGIDVPAVKLLKVRSSSWNGGFADFDVHLGLAGDEHEALRRELQRLAQLSELPRLSPVPVVDGRVSLMLFGRMSGQPDEPAAGGADPGFVRQIRHAAKPALYGDNRAAFSVQLDERGITVLDKAMRGEMAPIGVVYGLDYLALRPAYHVHLKIHWDRVQDFLDTQYGQEGLFTSVQIQDTVDKLIEQREIEFEADTFVPEDEGGGLAERRDAAVARVRDMITDAFFESSLDPQRQAPDGWDKAASLIKSFSPQRVSNPIGVFSYRRTHYSRVDQKRLDVNFSERTTIKRSLWPQGHLSGLFGLFGQGFDPARLITEVDADDPWFKRRRLRLISRANFQTDPVRAIAATARYGGVTQTALLDAQTPERELEWASSLQDGRMVEPVELSFELELQPSPEGERPLRLRSGPVEVPGDSIGLEPRELFALEELPLLTLPNFPFDRYPRVDVQLRYDDPAHGIRQDDLVSLSRERPNASWQRFLVGAPAGPVQARITYHGADHRRHERPFAPLDRPQVDVEDPFPARLRVDVVAALDFGQVQQAFVDLLYEDEAHGLRLEDAQEISAESPARPFLIARVDPMLNRVRYRVTILMRDASLLEGPWSTTLARRIFVRPDLRGHRAVRLQAPADFAARRLERLTVEARAHDALAGLSFGDRFEFDGPDDSAVFEFDFVDPAADGYEIRVRRLYRNGLSAEQDWSPQDADDLTIAAG